MQVIETNDPVEAQRCRRAQYVGFPTAVNLGRVEVRWRGAVRETGIWSAMDRHHYSKRT
jgi:hypothetical protein